SEREGSILAEISSESSDKQVTRFISTHPDQDHISGLVELDDLIGIRNFYCVDNGTRKTVQTADFLRYCELRDSDKAYYVTRNCSRRWMNLESEERGSSGINILWPIADNEHHLGALADAAAGMKPNNISCIVKYSRKDGAKALWMGDLETDYMEKIQELFELPKIDILFAPHHGRTSGKVPKEWLEQMDPGLIIVGEAPSEYLDYYAGYDVLTQNSAGDLLFDCVDAKTHIYASEHTYNADCLDQEGLDHSHGLYYVGTLQGREET
ncbi:MAG: hypothetical protein J0H98_06380, partial [Solirubrobacterales bacterium]|nr:hypothetical protein [Solirubrobacterales bacterium]